MIIGIIGTIGSGKDLVARYICKKYRFGFVGMSNILRTLAKKKKIKITRENLHNLQDKCHKKYGKSYLIDTAINKMKKNKKKDFVIAGIRTPTQAKVAKKAGAKIILVDASPKIRFQRTKKRRRKGFSKTLKEFQKQENKEWKNFNFRKTFIYTDYKVNNNGTKKQLFSQVDKIIRKTR